MFRDLCEGVVWCIQGPMWWCGAFRDLREGVFGVFRDMCKGVVRLGTCVVWCVQGPV